MKRKLVVMFVLLTLVCGGCGKSDVGTTNASETSEEKSQSEDVSAKELNPFEGLEVTYEGFDGDGRIKIDTSNCSDKVKENVEFTYSGGTDGELKNNQEIVISAKVKNEKYTLTKEYQYYYVDGLLVLSEETPMFHDGIAWLEYTDPTVDKTYLGAMDTSGKLLFQYERNTLGKYTDFKDGKAMIAFADAETVGIIDKTGKILKTIDIKKSPIYGNKELDNAKYSLLELDDGYCFVSAEVKDFDNNYYVYIVYDLNGECVLIDKSYDIYVHVRNMGYDVFKLIGESAEMLCYFLEDNIATKFDFSSLSVQNRVDGKFDSKGYTLLNSKTLLDENANVIEVDFPFDMDDWELKSFGSGKYILFNKYENKLRYYDVVSKKYVDTDEYVEKIKKVGAFKNDIVFMKMIGADNIIYTAVFGEDWKVLIEPMLISNYGYFEEGFWINPTNEHKCYGYDYSGNILFSINGASCEFLEGFAYRGYYEWINTKGEVVIDSIDCSDVTTIVPSKVESESSVYALEGEYVGYFSSFRINADGTMEYMQDGETYPVTYTQKGDCVWNGTITWTDGRTTEVIIYMDDAGNLFVDGRPEIWEDEYYRRQP